MASSSEVAPAMTRAASKVESIRQSRLSEHKESYNHVRRVSHSRRQSPEAEYDMCPTSQCDQDSMHTPTDD